MPSKRLRISFWCSRLPALDQRTFLQPAGVLMCFRCKRRRVGNEGWFKSYEREQPGDGSPRPKITQNRVPPAQPDFLQHHHTQASTVERIRSELRRLFARCRWENPRRAVVRPSRFSDITSDITATQSALPTLLRLDRPISNHLSHVCNLFPRYQTSWAEYRERRF